MELNPLSQINPITIVAVLAVFVIAHFVMKRTFFAPVIAVMEERSERLEAAARKRDEAAELSRTADEDAESILARGRERAERVMASVRDRTQTARAERLDGARSESAAYMEQGRLAIAQEREAELTRLRQEAASCVSLACDRLLGGVDDHKIESVVDRLVARRVH